MSLVTDNPFQVACPHCKAAVGKPCRKGSTVCCTQRNRAYRIFALDGLQERLATHLETVAIGTEVDARTLTANLRGILVGQPGSKFYRAPPQGGSDTDVADKQLVELVVLARHKARRLGIFPE